MYAVVIVLLAAAIMLGGGIATADAQLSLGDDRTASVNAHSTLRINNIEASNVPEGQSVEYSINALEGARIHPVTGHLVYVPPERGQYTITVTATAGTETDDMDITVDVGTAIATVTSMSRASYPAQVVHFDAHINVVGSFRYHDGEPRVLGRGFADSILAGNPSGGRTSDRIDPPHPLANAVYYYAIRPAFELDFIHDRNVYAQFTPLTSIWSIIANPATRPAPYVPDMVSNAFAGIPVPITPELVSFDGGGLAITQVTNGTLGDAMSNSTAITYTPDGDADGEDQITYTVTDNRGVTGTGTINITVAQPRTLSAADDMENTDEDVPVNIDVLANDMADGATLDVSTQPMHGSATREANNTITYVPGADRHETVTFMYTISRGDDSQTATVTVAIRSVTDAPDFEVPQNDPGVDFITIPELEPYGFDINVTNPDNVEHAVSIDRGDPPAAGADITQAGEFSWTPAESQGPGRYTITISLDPVPEGMETVSRQITLSVTEANQDPVFAIDTVHEAVTGTPFTLELAATDADEPEQDLAYDFVGDRLGAFIADDTLVWNPRAGDVGAERTLTIRVRDNHATPGEDTADLVITTARGPGPLIDDPGSPHLDAYTTFRTTASTSEAAGGVEWSMADPLVAESMIHPVSGHISYVPTPDQAGRQVLYVNATDDDGTSVWAVPVWVRSPFGTFTDVERISGTQVEATYDTEIGRSFIIAATTTGSGGVDIYGGFAGANPGLTVTLKSQRISSGSPAPDTLYFFEARKNRNSGGVDGNIFAQYMPVRDGFEIIANPVSRPGPVAPDIARDIEPGVTAVFEPRLVGLDGDTIRITNVTDGAKGQGTMINDTHVSYTPNAGAGGPDRIVYTVRDDRGRTSTGDIDVILPDIDLLARDDPGVETDAGKPVNIDVLANDDGNDVTVTVTTLPRNGIATPETNGTITYRPNDDFNGVDTFVYTISRDTESDTATVTVTVHEPDEPVTFVVPPNDAGVAFKAIPELEPYSFNIMVGNPDNLAHTISLEFGDPPATGADITQAGIFSWEPTEAQGPGLYNITITVDHEPEDVADVTQQFTLSVTEANQDPVFSIEQTHEAVTGTPFMLNLTATDDDEPDQDLAYDFVGDGLGAFIVDGTLIWNPRTSDVGVERTLTVRVRDSHTEPGEDTAGLVITTTRGAGPAISETSNSLRRAAHTTLRLDMSASESTGDVEWGIAALGGARIHPVSGHLSYVPVPGHGGTTQVLMVNATDDDGTSVRAIPVGVGEPFGRFNSVDRLVQDGETWGQARYTSNIGTTYVYDGTVADSVVSGSVFSTASEGATVSRGDVTEGGQAADTVYYFEARQVQTAEHADRNIFAQWIPSGTGFEIIANPVSRPDPVAPDITRNIEPDVTAVFAPRLVGLDGDDIIITDVTDGTKGQGTVINATHISYMPEAGAGGDDHLVYTVKDNRGRTSTGDINITLPDVPPDANDDPNIETDEDTPVNIEVLANDAGNGLTVTVTTLPRNGTATPHDNGTITYDPKDNFNGEDTFVYTISRDTESDTATVTVTVNPVDDPATFDVPPNDEGVDHIEIQELAPFGFDINVTNPDNIGYVLSLDLGDPPAAGADITQQGNFSWTPTESQGPGQYTVTIIVDPAPEGRPNVTQQITLSVTEVNQNPVFDAYDATPMVPTNGTLDITLTARDADEPEQTITYTITGQNSTENLAVINGTTGRLTWTPVTEETRTITVRASDNFEGTPGTADITLTVSVMNLAAVMPSQTDPQRVVFTIVPFTADPIIGRVLHSNGTTVHDFGEITPTAAMAPIDPPPDVPLSLLMTNTTYTFEFARSDDTGYAGDDVIRGTFTTMSAQIALGTLEPQMTSEGGTINYTIPLDNPDGQDVTWRVVPDDMGAQITEDGRFVWMPGEEHGGATHQFIISATALIPTSPVSGPISVTVDEINENPVFTTVQTQFDTNVGASFEYDFDATDADIPEQAVSYEIVSQNPTENPAEIDATTGLLIWMPVTVETRMITIRASDNHTAPGTVDTTITVRVLPDLDASDDTIYSPSTGEGTVHVLDVLGNDMAPEGTMIESVTHPAITLGGTEHTDDASAGTAVADGRMINYTEGSSYNMAGSSNVTFTYTILLGTYRDTATVTLINSEIPALVAVNDAYTIMEDQEMVLDVLANDTAVQAGLAVSTQPENGTATETNNTITYRPNDDFNGQNTFEYVISRGDDSDTATVTVTVTPVNDAPVIADIAGRTVPELEPVRIPLVITDVDNETSSLVVGLDNSIDDPPLVSGGELVWTPTESQGPGSYTFTVIADDRINTGSADVTINVTEVNQDPVFDDIELNQNATTGDLFELDLNATDADEPEQTITYDITEQNPSDNPAEIDGTTGEITWTPAVAQNRTITVRASDDYTPNGTASLTIVVAVTGGPPENMTAPENTPPVADNVRDSVTAGRSVLIDLSEDSRISDEQQSADTLRVSVSDVPSQGTATVNGIVINYTAFANATGTDTFGYTVTDDGLEAATAMITVMILPPDAPPIFTDDGSTVTAPVSNTTITGILEAYMSQNLVAFSGHPAPGLDAARSSTSAGFLIAGILVNGAYAGLPGAGIADSDVITVFVNEIGNVPPVLSGIGNYTVNARDTLEFAVSAADFNDTASYRLSDAPADAEISGEGVFEWTPSSADAGDHAFAITAYDRHNATDSESVTVTVLQAGTPNQNPDAPDVTATVATNGRVTIIPAISDPDGDPVRIIRATGNAGGSVTFWSDHIEYTAGPNPGIETVSYTVADSRGAGSTGAITITIR